MQSHKTECPLGQHMFFQTIEEGMCTHEALPPFLWGWRLSAAKPQEMQLNWKLSHHYHLVFVRHLLECQVRHFTVFSCLILLTTLKGKYCQPTLQIRKLRLRVIEELIQGSRKLSSREVRLEHKPSGLRAQTLLCNAVGHACVRAMYTACVYVCNTTHNNALG